MVCGRRGSRGRGPRTGRKAAGSPRRPREASEALQHQSQQKGAALPGAAQNLEPKWPLPIDGGPGVREYTALFSRPLLTEGPLVAVESNCPADHLSGA